MQQYIDNRYYEITISINSIWIVIHNKYNYSWNNKIIRFF